MRKARASGQLLVAVGLSLPLTGCYSFALHQTAQRLAPGQTSITPGISRQAFISGDDWDYHDGFWTVDVQVRHGLEKYEIGGRISRINLQDGYQFVSFDPKIPLVEDRLAFFSPIGFFFSDLFPGDAEIDAVESFQVPPLPHRHDPPRQVGATSQPGREGHHRSGQPGRSSHGDQSRTSFDAR